MNIYQCFLPLGGAVNRVICYLNFIAQLIWPANCYKTTPIHMPTHCMLFIFYHMITNMTLSFLSHYLYLSLISLIYIPMESSRISITPYNDTFLIVITHSTFILTYAKSSLPYALLILRSPLAD